MIVVLAIDGLEYELVEKFLCSNLKQKFYGKTDISDFSEPRTMVLWSSFMSGVSKEKEILAEGNNEMWNKKWDIEETFFSKFKNPIVIDLPGYSYDAEVHKKSRMLLKRFFEAASPEMKTEIVNEYNKDAFEHHRKIRNLFLQELKKPHDFILGYFSAADVLGHLNFGNHFLMKTIYKEMDDIAGKIDAEYLIILSDHGMEGIGMFGDHSRYGFWSTNFRDLGTPKITSFREILKEIDR